MPDRLERLEQELTAAQRDPYRQPRRTWIQVLVPRPWLPTLAFLMGAAIFAGGRGRFAGPPFYVVRAVAPWWVWGCVFAGMGVAELLPVPASVEWIVRYLSALPFAALAVGLGFAAPLNHTVALTGVAVYGWVAAVHLRIAVLRREVAKEEAHHPPAVDA
jgi:hypothetical protein